MRDALRVRGMIKFQIQDSPVWVPDGPIISESQWTRNTITTLGLAQYLCQALGQLATGYKFVQLMTIGQGAAPVAADSLLPSEITDVATFRRPVTANATQVGAGSVQFTATWASSFITSAKTISNAAILNSVATGGQIFAGGAIVPVQSWGLTQSCQGLYIVQFVA